MQNHTATNFAPTSIKHVICCLVTAVDFQVTVLTVFYVLNVWIFCHLSCRMFQHQRYSYEISLRYLRYTFMLFALKCIALSHITHGSSSVHHLHHLHYHRLHLLLLAQYFILNSRLGSSANPFLHRPVLSYRTDSTDSRAIYNDFNLLNGWICLHGVLD